jgi:hypothetical protein
VGSGQKVEDARIRQERLAGGCAGSSSAGSSGLSAKKGAPFGTPRTAWKSLTRGDPGAADNSLHCILCG